MTFNKKTNLIPLHYLGDLNLISKEFFSQNFNNLSALKRKYNISKAAVTQIANA